MHSLSKIAAVALALALGGCATPLFHKAPPVGTPLAELTARFGQPNEVYADPDGGQVLEYRGQPMGQFQHMARFGADGKLLSYEQVLTSANFAKVEVNRWNKDAILRHFGRPAEVARVRLDNAEVWSYRYKQDGVWNSMMNVYFNERGIVRQLRNEPDPLLDDRYKGF